MAFRLVLTTLVVTVLVMGAMTAVMTWRKQTDAVHTVQRDMDGALTGVDQSLQLVYAGATASVLKLLPARQHALGGGLPEHDGKTADRGDATGGTSLPGNGIPHTATNSPGR